MAMPDSQQNLYLIKNVEDIVVFLGLKIITFFVDPVSQFTNRTFVIGILFSLFEASSIARTNSKPFPTFLQLNQNLKNGIEFYELLKLI